MPDNHNGGTLVYASLLFLSAATLSLGAPKELLENPGFEETGDGLPTGWVINAGYAGKVTGVPEARTGQKAVRIETRENQEGWITDLYTSAPLSLRAGAVYHASLWARGEGSVQVLVYQYTGSGLFIGSTFLPEQGLTPEWRPYTVEYRPTDRRLGRGCFVVRVVGEHAAASVDDCSFTFDPDENPGIESGRTGPARRELRLTVEGRDATARVWVNGQPASVEAGTVTATVTEGLIAVAVEGQATGQSPGLRVAVVGSPETATRWRCAPPPAPPSQGGEGEWTTVEFDDAAWTPPTAGEGGFLWAEDRTAPRVWLRQVLLWNETHYGPNRCLLPKMREWGFATGSLEVFNLALYSPLPKRLDGYEFILDLSSPFELLDLLDYRQRWIVNTKPERVETEKIEREGQPYTRYRIAYAANYLTPEQTCFSQLPVRMAAAPTEKQYRFYYQRLARGNLTELEQSVPVRVLPPIRGQRPRRIVLFRYVGPWSDGCMPRAYLRAEMERSVQAGQNHFDIPWMPAWQDYWRPGLQWVHDYAVELGAHPVVWPLGGGNLGLNYGGLPEGHCPDFVEWLKNTPEAQGRGYRQTAWGERGTYYYCNQWVIDDGRSFQEALQREYQRFLEIYPQTKIIWLDWEHHDLNPDGTGTCCFCDRCKAAFRKWAQVPADVDLTDDAVITQKYPRQWQDFRGWQDGQVMGKIRGVVHELGRQFMVYSWSSNLPFWKGCRGQIDLAFPGLPGNSPLDSFTQAGLDAAYMQLRDALGPDVPIIGQRIVGDLDLGPQGWAADALTWDGFLHPEEWKTGLLRAIASLHGGLDLATPNMVGGGAHYYIGEATRLLGAFEDLFVDGERADDLARSPDLAYPDLLVLRRGDERLVLLFNEDDAEKEVELENLDTKPGQVASAFDTPFETAQPARFRVRIPPRDVAVVYLQAK